MKCQTDLAGGDNHACVSTDRSWYCSGTLEYSETRLLRTLKGNEKRYALNKVRFIQNKGSAKRPIGDVRDRRRERKNRMYVLSRVRTNRVSLYEFLDPPNASVVQQAQCRTGLPLSSI